MTGSMLQQRQIESDTLHRSNNNNRCLLVLNPCILFCQYPRAVLTALKKDQDPRHCNLTHCGATPACFPVRILSGLKKHIEGGSATEDG